MFKKFIQITAVVLSAVILSQTVSADWKYSDNNTYYTDESGNYKTGWQTIDGKDYYFKKTVKW